MTEAQLLAKAESIISDCDFLLRDEAIKANVIAKTYFMDIKTHTQKFLNEIKADAPK